MSRQVTTLCALVIASLFLGGCEGVGMKEAGDLFQEGVSTIGSLVPGAEGLSQAQKAATTLKKIDYASQKVEQLQENLDDQNQQTVQFEAQIIEPMGGQTAELTPSDQTAMKWLEDQGYEVTTTLYRQARMSVLQQHQGSLPEKELAQKTAQLLVKTIQAQELSSATPN